VIDDSKVIDNLKVIDNPKVIDNTKDIDNPKVCNYLDNGNWTVERDDDLTAPFAYKNHTWIAFDDAVSLRIKSKYALLRGLAGIGVHTLDDDDSQGSCSQGPYPLLTSIFEIFTQLARTPRKAVLSSLVRDLETSESIVRASYIGSSTDLRISPFRIVRVVDKTGEIRAIRSSDDDNDSRYECSRQGYYRDPSDCSLFYRCVKFNQFIDDYTVFEYSCPEGLVFDDRWEICAWPSTASPCDGSSEIFPVPKRKNICSSEGYFTDPENCRWFFACKDYYGTGNFTLYEFRCPFGLGYDEDNKICNWPWLVPHCKEYEPIPIEDDRRGRGKAIIASSSFQSHVNEPGYKECIDCDVEITVGGDGIYHPDKGIIISTSYLENAEKLRSLSLKHRQQSSNTLDSEGINDNVGLKATDYNKQYLLDRDPNSKSDTSRFILKSDRVNFRGNTFSKDGKSFSENGNKHAIKVASHAEHEGARYDVVPTSDEHRKNANSHSSLLAKNRENTSRFNHFKTNKRIPNIRIQDDITKSSNLFGKSIAQNIAGGRDVSEYIHSTSDNDKVKTLQSERGSRKKIFSHSDISNSDKYNFNSFRQGNSEENKHRKLESTSKNLGKSNLSSPRGTSERRNQYSKTSREEIAKGNTYSESFDKFETNNQQHGRTNFFNSRAHEFDKKINDDTNHHFSTPTQGINQPFSGRSSPNLSRFKNKNSKSQSSGKSRETQDFRTEERKIASSNGDSLSHFTNKEIFNDKLQNSGKRIHLESEKGSIFNEPKVKFNSFGVKNDETNSGESTIDSSHFKIVGTSEKRRPQSSRTTFESKEFSHNAGGYKYDESTVKFEPHKNREPSIGDDSKFDEENHSESQKGYRHNEPEVKFNPFGDDDKDDKEDIGLSHFKISDSSEKRRPQSSRTASTSEDFSHTKQNNARGYKEPSISDDSKFDEENHSESQKGYRYNEPEVKFNPFGDDDKDEEEIGFSHFKISDSNEKRRPQSSSTASTSEDFSHTRQNNGRGYKYDEPTVKFEPFKSRESSIGDDSKFDEETHSESQKGYRYNEPEVKFNPFGDDDKDDEEDIGFSHFKISDSNEKRRPQSSRTVSTSEDFSHSEQNNARGYKYEEPTVKFESLKSREPSIGDDSKFDEETHSESQKGYRYNEPEVKFNPFGDDDKDDEDIGFSHFKISDSSKKRRPQSSRTASTSEDFSHTEQNNANGYKYKEPVQSFNSYNNRNPSNNDNSKSDEKIHSESQKGYKYDEPKIKFNPHADTDEDGLSHFKISDSGEKRRTQIQLDNHNKQNNGNEFKYEEPTKRFDSHNRKPFRANDPKSNEKTHSESQEGHRFGEPKVKFNAFDHKDESNSGFSHFKVSNSSVKRKPQSSRTTFKSKTVSNEYESKKTELSSDPYRNRETSRNGDIKSDENIHSESQKGYRYEEPKVKFNPFGIDDSEDEDQEVGGLSHFKISKSDEKKRPQSSQTTFVSKDFRSSEQTESRGYKYEEPKISFNPYNNRESSRGNSETKSDEKVLSESQKGYRYDEPKQKFNPFDQNKDDKDLSALGLSHFKISDSGEKIRPQNSHATFLSEETSHNESNKEKGYKYEDSIGIFYPYNNRESSSDSSSKSNENIHSESQKGYRYEEPKVKFNPFNEKDDDDDESNKGLSHFKISNSNEKRRPQSSYSTFKSETVSSKEHPNANEYKHNEPNESFDPNSSRGSSRSEDFKSEGRIYSESQKAQRYDESNELLNKFDSGYTEDEVEGIGELSHFKISNSDEKRKPQSSRSSKEQNNARGYKYEEPKISFNPYNRREPSRDDNFKSDEKIHSESQKGYRYDEPKVKFTSFEDQDKGDEEARISGLSHFKISNSGEKQRPQSSRETSISETVNNEPRNRESFKYDEPKISFKPILNRKPLRNGNSQSDEKFHSESQKGYRYDEPKVKFNSFDNSKDDENLSSFGVSHFKISDSVENRKPQSSSTTFISGNFNPSEQNNANGNKYDKHTLRLNSHNSRDSSANSDSKSSEGQKGYSFEDPKVKFNLFDDEDKHDENDSNFGVSHFKIFDSNEKRRPHNQPSKFTSETISPNDRHNLNNEGSYVNFGPYNDRESSRNDKSKSDSEFHSENPKGSGYEEPKLKFNTFDEDRNDFGLSHFKISDSGDKPKHQSSRTSFKTKDSSHEPLGNIKGTETFRETSFGSSLSHETQEETEKSRRKHHFATNLKNLNDADHFDHSSSHQIGGDSYASEKSDSFNFDSEDTSSLSSSNSYDSSEKFKPISIIDTPDNVYENSQILKPNNVPNHFSSHYDNSDNVGFDNNRDRIHENLPSGQTFTDSNEFREKNRKSSLGNSNIGLESNEDSYSSVPSPPIILNSRNKPFNDFNNNKIIIKSTENRVSQIYDDYLENRDQTSVNSKNTQSSNTGKSLTSVNSLRQLIHKESSLLSKYGNSQTKLQRFGPGGFRNFEDDLGPEVCERAGLFRHPKSCNQFYECYWDRWLQKFTLHIFNCPVTIVYDSSITGCNWPFNGPPCTEEEDT
ncbi:hypothetical protein Avbf_13240, partial [Armadillidium vulgare]